MDYYVSGYENEYRFVRYLNRKKVKELNPLFRDLLFDLFQDFDEEEVVIAWKNDLPQKADLFVKLKGEFRSISLKKGIKNSVHASRISEFIHFLIDNGISKEAVMEYLKFHYADGTTNNKGEKRQSALEYKRSNQEKIDMINKEFNGEKFLRKAIEFFVLKGNMSKIPIDVLVYGTTEDFFWIKKEEIMEQLLSKKDIYASGVHFSNLLCQPLASNLNYNQKYEKCRYLVQLKWYSLFDDIVEVMNKRALKTNLND